MSDDGSGDEGIYRPTGRLPAGVKKEVIKEAEGDSYRTPKKNDELTVDYVGTLEDGTEFDSSLSRGAPINFTLGVGNVIKGWDVGVATMRKGEKAKFTLSPEFAYGEAGSEPKIPPNATLIFTIELISWVAKDDLFNDGLVTKCAIDEASGFEHPEKGKEIRISVKVSAQDGSVIDEKTGIDYILDSGELGPITRVVDKALSGMSKGEKCALQCAKGSVYEKDSPHGEVRIELSLEEIYSISDVSFAKDGSMMKKTLADGDGYEKPEDGRSVTVSIQAATDGSSTLPSFTGTAVLSFTLGNGETCDALECAAGNMKKGERAMLTYTRAEKCREPRTGLAGLDGLAKVVLTVECLDFQKGPNMHDVFYEDKVELAMRRKDVGAKLFKAERWELALEKYKKVIELLKDTNKWSDECKAAAKDLTKASNLNKAACYLKIGDHLNALSSCNEILRTDHSNVKALFRRAKAHYGRNELTEAITDLERVLEFDPQNGEARTLLPQVKRARKVADKESMGTFGKMCQGFGKMGRKEDEKKEPESKTWAEPVKPKSTRVEVIFRVDREPKDGESVHVYGDPEELGAWDAAKAVPLRLQPQPWVPPVGSGREPPKIYAWEATVEIEESAGRAEYKYFVRGPGGDTPEDTVHAVNLAGMGNSRQRCRDSWRSTCFEA